MATSRTAGVGAVFRAVGEPFAQPLEDEALIRAAQDAGWRREEVTDLTHWAARFGSRPLRASMLFRERLLVASRVAPRGTAPSLTP